MKRLVLDTFLLTGGFSFELHALDFGPCQVCGLLGMQSPNISAASWRVWPGLLLPFRICC